MLRKVKKRRMAEKYEYGKRVTGVNQIRDAVIIDVNGKGMTSWSNNRRDRRLWVNPRGLKKK